jgi:hypothetical protein
LGATGDEVGLGARVLLVQHRLELHAFETGQRAGSTVVAKGVVGLQQRDAVDADQVQVANRAFGFALVGGAHVEDPGVHRLVQQHGAGGRRDQRHLEPVQHRHDGLGLRRAAVEEQRDGALLDQLLRVLGLPAWRRTCRPSTPARSSGR